MNARHVSGLLLLVAGCSVPGRDNPLDPQNRLLFAAYLRLPGGEHSNAGSWGATWTLDATAACPEGSCPGRFSFDLDGDGVWDLAGQEALVDTVLPVLPGDFAQGGTALRELRVRRDYRALGLVTVVLTNAAPHVDPGEDVFVPPGGGTVVLDACGGGDGA
jgi:hypothetical protein